jgi:hypothetical protein
MHTETVVNVGPERRAREALKARLNTQPNITDMQLVNVARGFGLSREDARDLVGRVRVSMG